MTAFLKEGVERFGLSKADYVSASKCAEELGDYSLALEYHELLMNTVGLNYSSCSRAAWLNFQAGGFRKALDFYKAAAACVPDACEPVLGALDCCVAMGATEDAAELLGIAVRRCKTLNF